MDSYLRDFFEKMICLKKEDIWKKLKGQISVNGTISELTLDFYSIFPINNIQFTVPVPSKLKSNMTWKFFICHFKKKPKENCNIACNYVLQKIHSEEISFPRRSSQKRLILRNIKQQKHCTYFRKQTSVFRLQHHYTLGYLRKKGSIL